MPEPLVPALRVVALTLGFALIGVWWVRYLHGVDEFERPLHWEALSVAYAVTIFAAVTLGALAREFQWNISPATLILVEPLRVAVLWHKSKQYRRTIPCGFFVPIRAGRKANWLPCWRFLGRR